MQVGQGRCDIQDVIAACGQSRIRCIWMFSTEVIRCDPRDLLPDEGTMISRSVMYCINTCLLSGGA